ncbi:MAG: CHAT domain-containing protein [Syntrophales bacterium]|nr:CHAT domain-containing protein [Syntrophales bacterium]
MKKRIFIFLIALSVMIPFRLALCQSKTEAVNEAFKLYQQGQDASQYGMYEEALSYFKKSLKINRKLNILRGVSANLNEIGMAYDSLGQYDKALSHYEEALKIDRKLNIPQDIATGLNNIAVVCESLGQYERALKHHEEALKIRRQLDTPRDIERAVKHDEEVVIRSPRDDMAQNLNNIALVHVYLGQYDKALSHYEEALKIDRKLNFPSEIAMDLDNIGSVYNVLGQYDKALSYYEEALKIREQGESIAISLDNIVFFYLAQKKYREVEERFLDKENNGYKGIRSSSLPEFYLATGRYGEALKLLKGIIPEEKMNAASRMQFHIRYGLALRGNGMLEEASSELLKAVSIAEQIREKVRLKRGFGEAGYTGGCIRGYRALVATLSERAMQGEKTDKRFSSYGKDLASSAFYFAEATKARTFLEAMANSGNYSRKELPLKIRKKERDILHQLFAIEDQWEETYEKNEEAFKRMVKRKESLRKKLDSLVSMLRKEYPMYAALNYSQPIPPERLPLKDNEVLLEYALGNNTGYLFKVNKGGIERVIKIPQGKEELKGQVLEFVLPLHDFNTKENFSMTSGNKLYKLLLDEALKDIPPDKDIIIVPDGILGLLPFEALVVTPEKDVKDAVFVGDRWKISYYQSAMVLALNRTLLKPSKAEKPFLVLSQIGNTRKDDRIPALTEVLGMKLDADTVVLSACVNGEGKRMEGEGVVNVSRAFHYAGARSVVVSLWKVAPKETIAYMESFSRYLQEGKTRIEALILTRRMIKSKYPNPFYWAPFILHGERY